MATQDPPYTRWLEATTELYSRYVQGGRLERFAAAVHSNMVFQSIYGATNDRNQDSDQQAGPVEVNAAGPPSTTTNRQQSASTPSTSTSTPTVTTRPSVYPAAAEFLHNAAREGCCAVVQASEQFINNVNVTDEGGVTALHIAAKYGNCEDVDVLLKAGATVTADSQGLTPLHEAAASTNPSPKIAELLSERMAKQMVQVSPRMRRVRLIDATIPVYSSEESTRGNTALHFAAGNKYMSHEFIRTLRDIDPSIKNKKGETAFHVGARVENPDIIVCMLEVFTPAEKGWKMKEIESESEASLLEMCAKRGNARAVALLIKYGANISDKALFSLIDESVNDPTSANKLIEVYHTITDNCVLWDWLNTKSRMPTSRHCPSPGTEPDAYAQKQRDVMLSLLTQRKKVYKDRNVNFIEYAILKGDCLFLKKIVNTPGVLRMTERDNEVKYNVTGFFDSLGCCGSIRKSSCCKRTDEVKPLSYIQLITENRHLWENTDILQVEPFLTLTQPMCAAVQLFNLVMAFFQLFNMIAVSIEFTPPFCSSKYQLDSTVLAICNSSAFAGGYIAVNTSPALNSLWLIWPTLVFFVTLIILISRFWQSKHARVADLAYGCLTVKLAFGPVLWAWYFHTFIRNELSLPLTSAICLFGWLVALSFFVSALENASIFLFLLKDIIVKDIASSFGIIFVFTMVSFSSAVHTLRKSAILGESNYFDTVYHMFASSLTAGEFIGETFDNFTNDAFHILIFQVVFAMYLCFATIFLFNILITMMSNRYEEARKTAKNIWRFNMVLSWTRLPSIFGLTSPKLLYRVFHKISKHLMHTTYDDVAITEQDLEVFLHLKYATN